MRRKINFIIGFYLHLSQKNIDYAHIFKTGCKRSGVSIELDSYPYYFKIKNSKQFLVYREVHERTLPPINTTKIYLNNYPKKYRLF